MSRLRDLHLLILTLSLARTGAKHELRTYFATLVIHTVSPLVLAVGVWLLYLLRTRVLKADRTRCRDQAILVLLLAIYLFLPPVSTVIFRGIPCASCVVRGAVRLSVA